MLATEVEVGQLVILTSKFSSPEREIAGPSHHEGQVATFMLKLSYLPKISLLYQIGGGERPQPPTTGGGDPVPTHFLASPDSWIQNLEAAHFIYRETKDCREMWLC